MPRQRHHGLTGRQIQAEWNNLVEHALRRGVRLPRGIGLWAGVPETRAYGMRRLDWLHSYLQGAQAPPARMEPREPGPRGQGGLAHSEQGAHSFRVTGEPGDTIQWVQLSTPPARDQAVTPPPESGEPWEFEPYVPSRVHSDQELGNARIAPNPRPATPPASPAESLPRRAQHVAPGGAAIPIEEPRPSTGDRPYSTWLRELRTGDRPSPGNQDVEYYPYPAPQQEPRRARPGSRGRAEAPTNEGLTADDEPGAVELPRLTSADTDYLVDLDPVLADYTYGIEIECFMPPGTDEVGLARHVTAAGVPCVSESYNHHVRGHWKIVIDGSLMNDDRGVEIVSPILRGAEGLRQLRTAMGALVSARCTVTRRCGFHVHVGADSLGVRGFKHLAGAYGRLEAVIDRLVSPSRRGNENNYCRSIAARIDVSQLASARSHEGVARAVGQDCSPRSYTRYTKLNLQCYWQHGTVEFRQHQGTVEFEKARHWVVLCLRFVHQACRAPADSVATTLDDMLTFLGSSSHEREYFTARAAHFAALDARRGAT